jgi:hypothetical protein
MSEIYRSGGRRSARNLIAWRSMTGDDDDPPDAFDDEPTNLDGAGPLPVAEHNTATYNKSHEFVAGMEAGFKEGIEAAVKALKVELVRAGCTRDEISHIVARIRAGTDIKQR